MTSSKRRRAGAPPGLILGLAAALVVVAGVVLALLVLRSKPAPETSPPPITATPTPTPPIRPAAPPDTVDPATVPPTVPAPPTTGERRGFAAEVLHPHDGGSVMVRPAGQRRPVTVRLIGLDAPRKASRDYEGQEPWGTRASQTLSLMITRKTVFVETDVQVKIPDSDAIWGYLWLGDRLVNEEVLRAGHAVGVTRVPNVKYAERLRAAAAEARTAGRGIWNPAEPLPEEPSKFVPTPVAKQPTMPKPKPAAPAGVLAEWRDGCVIGNKDGKKYHVPGGRYYDKMKSSSQAVFFATREDAEKAGYTASAK
jgi:endonuclease YncB( thermonuclease family)